MSGLPELVAARERYEAATRDANAALAKASSEWKAALEAAKEGHTLQELGDALGVSRQRVSQLLQRDATA